eukprot:SAG31_NODE_24277_length_485_cov_0.870466_1_plen_74_part_10
MVAPRAPWSAASRRPGAPAILDSEDVIDIGYRGRGDHRGAPAGACAAEAHRRLNAILTVHVFIPRRIHIQPSQQ